MSDVDTMIRDIEREVELTRFEIGRNALAAQVLSAMRRIPRHRFVSEDDRALAYYNGPVAIGHGQTISQPYIVALMTDLLDLESTDVILEVGTGSGYQAAVLSQLVKQVYSVERISELADAARSRLDGLGYDNVEVRIGDGYHGLPEHAPYDGIIVTAAAPHIPGPLVEQLKPGARLIVPVGGPFQGQELMLVQKEDDGSVSQRDVLSVAFVPLTGDGHNDPARLDRHGGRGAGRRRE